MVAAAAAAVMARGSRPPQIRLTTPHPHLLHSHSKTLACKGSATPHLEEGAHSGQSASHAAAAASSSSVVDSLQPAASQHTEALKPSPVGDSTHLHPGGFGPVPPTLVASVLQINCSSTRGGQQGAVKVKRSATSVAQKIV